MTNNKIKLTSKNVERIFLDCLLNDGEDTVNAIKIEGIMQNYGFNPTKVQKYNNNIYEMLQQLPKQFQMQGGGGWSFLNACMDKNDNQWTGLHSIMEQLFCLGLAIGKVKNLMPREMWSVLPGEMPYYTVL